MFLILLGLLEGGGGIWCHVELEGKVAADSELFSIDNIVFVPLELNTHRWRQFLDCKMLLSSLSGLLACLAATSILIGLELLWGSEALQTAPEV
jgi:hypothetical protein